MKPPVVSTRGQPPRCSVEPSPGKVTRLLRKWTDGDRSAFEELTAVVYPELRRLAAGYMRRERPSHTLQPTALVHEVYLRLVGETPLPWRDRVHLFAVAARLMRRILVDHARRRRRHKRRGGQEMVVLEEGLLPAPPPGDRVALDDALEALARYDVRKARALELHQGPPCVPDEARIGGRVRHGSRSMHHRAKDRTLPQQQRCRIRI
jgi:RNA polymerase sigma factor (TIGR02999 family)